MRPRSPGDLVAPRSLDRLHRLGMQVVAVILRATDLPFEFGWPVRRAHGGGFARSPQQAHDAHRQARAQGLEQRPHPSSGLRRVLAGVFSRLNRPAWEERDSSRRASGKPVRVGAGYFTDSDSRMAASTWLRVFCFASATPAAIPDANAAAADVPLTRNGRPP